MTTICCFKFVHKLFLVYETDVGKRYELGFFDNKENATLVRKAAEKEYFAPIIEKYMGKGKKTNSDPKSEQIQQDIPASDYINVSGTKACLKT